MPKDIQRLLCDYAIPGIADVDALVDKKINWLRNHFAQTVNGKTLAQICGESQNDNENAAYLMDDPQPAIGLEEFTQFKQLINIEKLDQHRPVIHKNIIELLQDIPLWHKRNTSEIAKRYTASTM